MPKKKVEVYDENQLIYPYIENDHITFSNGMKVSEMLNQGISMPTITHDKTSFKVGIGDSDVSSSIVDSSVSKMVIKGQTYQNILPEPSLINSMTNGKSAQKLNEGYENVEVVDGVAKSAILKGNTLVNKMINARYRMYERLDIKPNSNNEFINTDNSGLGFNILPLQTSVFEPNKTYTFFLFLYEIGDGGLDRLHYFVGGERLLKIGLNKGVYTTSSSINDNIYEHNIQIRSSFKAKLVIVEGNYINQDFSYFDMLSVKMPVLTTAGKNLFDGELEDGSLNLDTGDIESNDIYMRTVNFIRINPNKEHRLKVNGTDNGRIYFYDINKSYISTLLNEEGLVIPSNAKYMKFRVGKDILSGGQEIQLEEGSIPTSYEPYKINILHTPEEVVLRSLPSGVKDTLNLNTGEYVKRIGEVVLDGQNYTGFSRDSEMENDATCKYFISNFFSQILDGKGGDSGKVLLNCDGLPSVSFHTMQSKTLTTYPCISNSGAGSLNLRVKKDLDSTALLLAHLQSNPLRIQYELATPVVKTVDLSSSGNWEKVVLDGSEDWQCDANNETGAQVYIPRNQGQKFFNSLKSQDGGGLLHNLKNTNYFKSFSIGNNYGMIVVIDKTNFPINIGTNITLSEVRELWKQWLSQNPITVWYQTQTRQDSTQVKELIFFKDGYIQLSSEADNSSIPTLDYQAKTSNSYVMDLMKTNTRYTMKAKSASGTFTIDGVSYEAGTNGTFTTPSLMTNKFLIINNKTSEEVMILEGDVVSKTIPYFKGIKSAFEDESKIEVLSTGKNLFDGSFKKGNINSSGLPVWSNSSQSVLSDFIRVKPSSSLVVSNYGNVGNVYFCEYDSEGNYLGAVPRNTCVTKINTKFIRIQFNNPLSSLDELNRDTQIEESTVATTYEPYKTNSTKIPLLSPLRSLPNGVCDEIVLDRERNKAQIIQRVEIDNETLSQLAKPLITEVDMFGYPFIYKDGYIFLNSEIAPAMEITYSINQSQQISASNEDIIRHGKELTYLQKLIAQYVQVNYESVLLSLKV